MGEERKKNSCHVYALASNSVHSINIVVCFKFLDADDSSRTGGCDFTCFFG